MESVQLYLNQQFANAWYSEVLYTNRTITGAVSVAGENYNDKGATIILITGLIITSTDLGALVAFTDQFARTFFQVHANGNSTGFYPVYLILKADSFRVNANFANANFSYTVQHQYLRWTDVKNPNRLPPQ